jgi:hypothetical protein
MDNQAFHKNFFCFRNPMTCAHCGKDFEPAWSDEEAEAEAKRLWGVDHATTDQRMVVVCDPCFQMMHPDKHPDLADQARERIRKGLG